MKSSRKHVFDYTSRTVRLEKDPAGQLEQMPGLEAPSTDPYRPASQAMQLPALEMPAVLLHEPLGQFTHTDALDAAARDPYVPATQASQLDEPDACAE